MDLKKLIGRDSDRNGAYFSPDRVHRYTLWRRWWLYCDPRDMVAFVGLNPSTADETEDDPTVRRCIDFAKRWNYGGMVMLNAFAFRSTDPAGLKRCADPVGPYNDDALLSVFQAVARVVLCFGNHAILGDRYKRVLELASEFRPSAFTITKAGMPGHPLYLSRRSATRPFWELQQAREQALEQLDRAKLNQGDDGHG